MRARNAILAVLVGGFAAACLGAEPPASSVVLPLPREESSPSQDFPRATGGNEMRAGPRSAWRAGLEDTPVRFIRLRYDGGDWDLNMGAGADYYFLIECNKLTGFEIAAKTEAIRAADLRKFPADQAPPFLFVAGSGRIELSDDDVKTLRWYCLDQAGMLFADCGGGTFDKAFRELMARCFPDLEWHDIANDDILYQVPYVFPSGAPPLWNHVSIRPLGLKYNDRWVVFYHPGNLGDAWKSGHSGTSPFLANRAYKLGVNVIHYAVTEYTKKHFGDAPKRPGDDSPEAGAPGRQKTQLERVLEEVSHERPTEPSVTLDSELERSPDEVPALPNPGVPNSAHRHSEPRP